MDLMNDIINGKIPAAARSFLMPSRLIAIYKDAEQESVRPADRDWGNVLSPGESHNITGSHSAREDDTEKPIRSRS